MGWGGTARCATLTPNFRQSFSKSTGEAGFNAAFDFDNSGTVNNADFAQFRSRFGKSFVY
jgi:hypothetical protein